MFPYLEHHSVKICQSQGPFSRQSLRLTPEGGGCFILLFIQILKALVVYGPDLNASTMLTDVVDRSYECSGSSAIRCLKTPVSTLS